MADLPNELAPNDSEALGVYIGEEDSRTPEQENEEVEERQVMTSMVPMLNELFEWFDEMIGGADSVAQTVSIKKKYTDFKLTTDEVIIAQHLVGSMLETKKQELASRFENYLNARNETIEEENEEDES